MDVSPFAKLSAELRNLIWRYSMPNNLNIRFRTSSSAIVQPAITQTCKQIRSETIMMFYHGLKINCLVTLHADLHVSCVQPDDGFWRFMAWLDATDAPKYKAVRKLTLTIQVLNDMTGHRVLLARDFCTHLASVFKRAKYATSRHQIQIVPPNSFKSPAHELYIVMRQLKLVEDALSRVGLVARVVRPPGYRASEGKWEQS